MKLHLKQMPFYVTDLVLWNKSDPNSHISPSIWIRKTKPERVEKEIKNLEHTHLHLAIYKYIPQDLICMLQINIKHGEEKTLKK